MMVKAGPAVDDLIEQLLPLLSQGRHPHRRRQHATTPTPSGARSTSRAKGLLFIGTGVSGGEEGALKGPSMMPGGSRDGLAARQADLSGDRRQGRPEERHSLLRMGRPARRGPLREDGPQRHRVRRHAAHLRSLLHAEARPLGLSNDELYDVFAEWNRGELDSYLIEITRDIFSVKDPETRRATSSTRSWTRPARRAPASG